MCKAYASTVYCCPIFALSRVQGCMARHWFAASSLQRSSSVSWAPNEVFRYPWDCNLAQPSAFLQTKCPRGCPWSEIRGGSSTSKTIWKIVRFESTSHGWRKPNNWHWPCLKSCFGKRARYCVYVFLFATAASMCVKTWDKGWIVNTKESLSRMLRTVQEETRFILSLCPRM